MKLTHGCLSSSSPPLLLSSSFSLLLFCSVCPSGSYTQGGSSSTRETCTICPGGWFCDGTSSTGTCLAGTFSPGGSASCLDCNADNTYSLPKASSCTTCTPGSFTSGGTDKKRTSCATCSEGNRCDGTSIEYVCVAGKFAKSGAVTCSECGSDTQYSAAPAQGSCATCNAGSFTAGNTATTRTSCSPCPAGKNNDKERGGALFQFFFKDHSAYLYINSRTHNRPRSPSLLSASLCRVILRRQ